ncbi:filamentous hemagglutinin N-terminal domain-containing protein, partial [Parvibaculum sp.]|uniref:two-partner secretion domain-containing protein n=1 Tax=Parvibaculum sp. TaxID=2024848 RepID=UPI001B07877C
MSGPRDMRRTARTGLAVAISVAWMASSSPLSAEPTNPVIVGDSAGLGAGAATIGSVSNGPGMDMTVDQHAERVFIDWQSFNIGTSDTVHFDQGGSHWIAVNRVTGGLGSTTIEGMLTATGHVWIIDPAGIAFSSDAVVDVGGLLATASNIDPGDFLAVTDLEDAGGFTFSPGGNGTAQISNAGTINSSGLLALIAPIVDNSGTLDSAYGDVLLGGANAFRLSFTAVERPADAGHPTAFDELLVTDFIIETPVTNDPTPGNETVPVTNTGNLTGANIIVSAASAGGGAFINMDGVVEATTIGDRSGDVVILGGGDFIGGAADASSGGTEAIRIDNADISAAGDFVAQGIGVSIDKGTGLGTLTAGSIRIAATNGDATSDTNLTATAGGIDISASGLVSLTALDAATTLDIEAADIDLNGTAVGGGAVTMTASAGDISGTDLDIEGASVELTGPVAATDSATITATTGDLTLH